MELIQSANLALRFLLELAALVAFGYWAYVTGDGPFRWVLAVALPLVVAVVWGLFVAPNAAVDMPAPAKFVLGLTILVLAPVALATVGRHMLAIVFAVVIIINAGLMLAWNQ